MSDIGISQQLHIVATSWRGSFVGSRPTSSIRTDNLPLTTTPVQTLSTRPMCVAQVCQKVPLQDSYQ
jgi:hypothetical protein